MVRVPGAADEAVRDLARSREDAVRECRNARHRLKALLLRNGIGYAGKSAWTAAHLRWLATLKLEHAAQPRKSAKTRSARYVGSPANSDSS